MQEMHLRRVHGHGVRALPEVRVRRHALFGGQAFFVKSTNTDKTASYLFFR